MKKRFLIILPIMIFCAFVFTGGRAAPCSDAVNIDKLMAKWRNSNNWILVENRRTEYKQVLLSIETGIFERNKNAIRIAKTIKYANDTEFKQIIIIVYKGGGESTAYIGLKEEWEKELRWRTDKNVGKISDLFESLKRYEIKPIIPLATIKNENNGYHFSGIETDVQYSKRPELKVIVNFNYILTFGNSTVKKPSGIN